MTTDRPYRLAMPIADALAELRRCSGTQFDPIVVATLVRMVESHQVERPATAAQVTVAAGTRVQELTG
jgi:HD-GYP domain-containing protein (c-di-GMP phosphodiesterase class II)